MFSIWFSLDIKIFLFYLEKNLIILNILKVKRKHYEL